MELSNFIPTSGIWLYLFIALAILLLIQLFYYTFYFGKLAKHAKKEDSATHQYSYPPISIIICAKNESKNLEINLPKVLEQSYPGSFEVIVVNDASEDNTELVLAHFKQKYNKLYFTSIPYDKKFRHGKKLALTIGIKAAKHEHLIFTDADCYPVSTNWLKLMAQGFHNNKEIVLGYGPYKKQKSFLNYWLRYDTFYIAAQYFSYALRGIPYMGVGRNLGYTKELFYKHQGFRKHQHILSGDDDLFIKDAATSNNVAIITHPESHTISEPSKTFKEWRRQKSRHLTTASHYNFRTKWVLGIEVMSRQIFWGTSLISIFFPTFAPAVLLLIFIKLTIQISALRTISKRFEQKDLLWGCIIFDFILPTYTGFLLLGGKRKAKRNKWT